MDARSRSINHLYVTAVVLVSLLYLVYLFSLFIGVLFVAGFLCDIYALISVVAERQALNLIRYKEKTNCYMTDCRWVGDDAWALSKVVVCQTADTGRWSTGHQS